MSVLDPAGTYDEIPVDDDAEPDNANADHDGDVTDLLDGDDL